MNKIKTLLILVFVVTLVVLVSGCRMLDPGDAGVDNDFTAVDELPQWLTLAHRAEAAEEPVVEEAVAEVEEAPAQPAQQTQQPAQQTQQPAQQTQQPAPQPSGPPRYKQPGTMEYLAKIQLDQAAQDVKSLDAQITAEADRDTRRNLILRRDGMVRTMYIIGEEIGLDINKEYGIKPVSDGTAAAGGASFLHDFNRSPSGMGD